jgi:primosomal protein N'
VARIRGWRRWHFILKSASASEFPRLFRLCDNALRSTSTLRVIVDVDPVTML